jgi:hypothetical protein
MFTASVNITFTDQAVMVHMHTRVTHITVCKELVSYNGGTSVTPNSCSIHNHCRINNSCAPRPLRRWRRMARGAMTSHSLNM